MNDENEISLIAIEDKYKQIKGLHQYKILSEKNVRAIAKKMVVSSLREKEIEVASLFSDRKEMSLGKKLVSKYLKDYTPVSVSDKNNLRHLIYLEIIQIRLQDKLNKLNESDAAVPLNMIDSVHKNLREINDLKLKLGLVGENREETRSDVYKKWELLKDKFKRWRENNQGSRTLVCPHCGKMVILKIRTENWEAAKHPFFKDRILANKHLVQLYNDGRVNREDVAKILESSEQYVDWLIDKWSKVEKEGLGIVKKPIFDEESSVAKEAKEKKVRENRCPKCDEGYLSCSYTKDGKINESCSSCKYSALYVCRRAKQVPIDFSDRRNNQSVTLDRTKIEEVGPLSKESGQI